MDVRSKSVLKSKYPFEYELSPEISNAGKHWLAVKLKNIGCETLEDLESACSIGCDGGSKQI